MNSVVQRLPMMTSIQNYFIQNYFNKPTKTDKLNNYKLVGIKLLFMFHSSHYLKGVAGINNALNEID